MQLQLRSGTVGPELVVGAIQSSSFQAAPIPPSRQGVGCTGWRSSHAAILGTAVLTTCSRPERKAAIEAMPPRVCQPIPRQSANFWSSALTGWPPASQTASGGAAISSGTPYAHCTRTHNLRLITRSSGCSAFRSGSSLRGVFSGRQGFLPETFPRLRGVNRVDSAVCPILHAAAPHLARPYDRH